jgi:MmyB-like transcription regulator ligand binding domain
LSTRSEEFRSRWAAHNVRQHFTRLKRFRHPVVGELHLLFEAMELSADTGSKSIRRDDDALGRSDRAVPWNQDSVCSLTVSPHRVRPRQNG